MRTPFSALISALLLVSPALADGQGNLSPRTRMPAKPPQEAVEVPMALERPRIEDHLVRDVIACRDNPNCLADFMRKREYVRVNEAQRMFTIQWLNVAANQVEVYVRQFSEAVAKGGDQEFARDVLVVHANLVNLQRSIERMTYREIRRFEEKR